VTHPAFSLEELMRELRDEEVPVESARRMRIRREATISRLKDMQARSVASRDILGRYRKKALVLLVALIPTGALAATWLVGTIGAHAATRKGSVAETTAVAPAWHAAHPGHAAAPAAAPLVVGSVRNPVAAATPATKTSSADTPALPHRALSTLAEENRLLARAMVASRRGDEANAVGHLDDFLRRFPESPLAQNAEVERFRSLARAGSDAAAREAARRYLAEHPEGMAGDEARRLVVGSEASPP
jgi:TolA-binding protein